MMCTKISEKNITEGVIKGYLYYSFYNFACFANDIINICT